ncbi:hypothetical protein FACS1894172_16630 [Spirochaetia bacterium]|nr:hypothetical protein FACS1894164_00850 [Spirochaetia bacterium]GHU35200.1 hypothetical protein FACS1894172_16630 [Spirochaetia bacterium]
MNLASSERTYTIPPKEGAEKNSHWFRKFILNIMTSGQDVDPGDELSSDIFVRHIVVNAALIIGTILLAIFGQLSLRTGNTFIYTISYIMMVLLIIAFILLRVGIRFTVLSISICIPFLFFCAYLAVNGAFSGFGVLWLYVFPVLAIFVLELQLGAILSIALLVITAAGLLIPGISSYQYPSAVVPSIFAVYFLVMSSALAYEQSRILKNRVNNKLVTAMQAERDGITENLKAGLLLMDKDYTILPLYSRVLEDIFSSIDLLGSNFVELLSESLSLQERSLLKDYFEMVINRSFDQAMLEDINPLHELNYKMHGTKKEKILRCAFAPVNRGDDETIILATIQDITKEYLLKKQLLEENNKRQDEMRSLFEVLQVEPRILTDFLEDSDYEFNRINDVLKDTDIESATVLVSVYQSIHAIKSNAVILGLQNYGEKLHYLETEIKTIQKHEHINFDDMLHLTLEIEKIMQEKDKFNSTIKRIKEFKVGSVDYNQGKYVLVESLSRTAKKVAAETNKKVDFIEDYIDTDAIDSGPRRVMKEVLMQIVRNAVYHGIETPEERIAAGKNETGMVHLSIIMESGKIHLKLQDDGRGIDFEQVRAKAKRENLFPGVETLSRKHLLQAIFMSGFSTAKSENMHAGRGVGLGLVLERVREQRGEIKLQTEHGKGTAFNIYLPVEQVPSKGNI